ncbi:CHAT domain-containing protein [Kineosporia babensis]|uniref:CHAT domain-containing protein n=1 Tax=Kineosporia babensis TaxID=499548 RepID=A0A9X1SZK4_9ACTN|nr:CHAT domain-containing protein [Kineosporia babensis]MCD5312058.1 CHAT domain-containing protein [Kineosporia babensis]
MTSRQPGVAALLIDLLLLEQHRVDPRPAPDVAGNDRILIEAATALAATCPRRALHRLSDFTVYTEDDLTLGRGFALAAGFLDTNALPYGAEPVTEIPMGEGQQIFGAWLSGDGKHLADRGLERPVADPQWRLVHALTHRVVPMLASSRLGTPQPGLIHGWRTEIIPHLETHPVTAPYGWTLYAEMLHRSGQELEAVQILERVLCAVPDDHAARGHAHRVLGDLAATPDTACEHWERSLAEYRQPGLAAGTAAVLLRLANAPGGSSAHLDEAAVLAKWSGHEGLTQVVQAHRRTRTTLAAREEAPEEWAHRIGSRSLVRGICRLLLAAAQQVAQAGDVLAGIDLCTEAMSRAQRIEAGTELFDALSVRATLLSAAHPLLSAVTAVQAIRSVHQAAAREPLLWARCVVLANHAVERAHLLQSAPLLERTIEVAEALCAAVPHSNWPELAAALTQFRTETTGRIQRMQAALDWIAARDVRDTGARIPQLEFEHLLDEALAQAQEAQDEVTVAAVHALRGDQAGAVAAAERVAASDFQLGAELLLLAGEPDAALRTLNQLPDDDSRGWPWSGPTLRAEILLAMGDTVAAIEQANQGMDDYRAWVARLGLDSLRVAAGQDAAAGRVHAAVVRAHGALWEAWNEGQHPDVSSDEAARAFAAALTTADEARGGAAVFARPQRQRVLRGRQLAEARWSTALEHLARAELESTGLQDDPSPELSGRFIEAEQELRASIATTSGRHAWSGEKEAAQHFTDSVANALPADTVLLEYYLNGAHLIILAIGPAGRAVRTPAASAQVRRLHGSVRRPAAPAELSELLLSPVARDIEPCRNVLIVPHGALSTLPWHTLPFGAGRLDDERNVSLLPAAGLIPALAAAPRPDLARGSLSIAAPDFLPGSLDELPASRIEGEVVARHLPAATLLTGPQASVAEIRNHQEHWLERGQDPRGPALVHIASHGYVDPDWPHLSWLALSGSEKLRLPDIFAAVSQCDVLLLSACQGAEGRATAAGDVIGPVGTALSAGVSHVVAPVGAVNDIVACLFMSEVARQLGSTPAPDIGQAVAVARKTLRSMNGEDRRERYLELSDLTGQPPGALDHPRWKGIGGCGDGRPDPVDKLVHIGINCSD